jgi:drug/metabolite transporter (DMT)-like permease
VDRRRLTGLALGAGSGVLYGSINVLAKPLPVHPALKGAIAYLASALVLSPWMFRLRVKREDWPKVLAMGLVGGGLAPMLLFFGLPLTAATDAGLLLTMELVATSALAFVFLRERFAGGEVVGLLLVLVAASLIAVAGGGTGATTTFGALLVLGAAVGWGVDNAVSARLAGDYELRGLIGLKGLLGGASSLAVALVMGASTPAMSDSLAMAAMGIVSIAASSMLFYAALRRVGAARTSAMNIALTALTGAAGGALLLHERLVLLHGVALVCICAGAALLARHRSKPESPKADEAN